MGFGEIPLEVERLLQGRFRIDQLLAFAWKWMTPMALVNIVVVATEVMIWEETGWSAAVILPASIVINGALAGLHAVVAQPHHMVELAVLVTANLVATAVRFVLLRGWVFHPGRSR